VPEGVNTQSLKLKMRRLYLPIGSGAQLMSSQPAWNRRTFVSALGLTVAAAAAPSIAEGPRTQTEATSSASPTFLAFAGFSARNSRDMDRIESYRVMAGKWILAGAPIRCENLRTLALHPKLTVLYAAHSAAPYCGLPRGSVSAFAFDSASGCLKLFSRQGLSLSAIDPEHLAVSPDGRMLVVSISDGGMYNFFSLASDGAILATPNALKQTGCGPHPLQGAARPYAAVFHSKGSAAYASDLGSDRVSHIAFDGDLPSVRSRVSLMPGSGPAYVVRHPSDELLVVASRLRPSLTIISIDPNSGNLLSPIEHFAVDAQRGGPLAMNRSGDRVYLTTIQRSGESMVSVFRLSRSAGRLRLLQRTPISKFANTEQLLWTEDQLLLTGTGGVVRLPLNKDTGLVGEPTIALDQPGALSIAVHML
jgi:6-phosphogluconolactonase